ncbi:uncharacterized protein LOC129766407 [Toxorhynchites rutilus septentrionalis]|uniref:uncharacterized protein LOC129766407 n=1 Tax=Toxorhynchites rutilus septentrionalis TaxID=329112 RepID=UPI002478B195|nr:uncharacterized protein LOC129766407 [Toxorhynchites rutilus septentrionalis]
MNQAITTTSINTGMSQIPVCLPSRTGAIPKETPLVPAQHRSTSNTITRPEDRSGIARTPIPHTTMKSPDRQALPTLTDSRSSQIPTTNEIVCNPTSNVEANRQISSMPTSTMTSTVQVINETAKRNTTGSHDISSDHRNRPTVVDYNISATPTSEELTKQLFELQTRMDSLRMQLAAKQSAQPSVVSSRSTIGAHSVAQHNQPPLSLPMPERIPLYEFPVSSSVSQACSRSTGAVSVCAASQPAFDSTPPNIRNIDSIIHYTPPTSTEPCSPPMLQAFIPPHRSTPQSNANSSSVHTVSACLSPIVTPMVSYTATNSTSIHEIPVSPPLSFHGPSSQQLAARHVVPRELPCFSGDPVEWPLFLSSFRNSTEMCGYSEGENLMRLQRCLKGNALEAVRSYLMQPSSVPLIMQTLKTLYGRPELIINSLLVKVRSTPTPKPERLETIISFGLACKNLCQHLQAAGLHSHLSNPLLLQELVEKLPVNIKLNWSLFKRTRPIVDLSTFGSFMDEIVVAASDVTFTHDIDGQRAGKQDKQKPKEKLFVNAHNTEKSTHYPISGSNNLNRKEYQPKPCTACEKDGHKIKDCTTFRNLTLGDRWKLVQERRLCRRCLIGHGKLPCKAGLCGENGCEDRHHKLLHPGKPGSSQTIDVPNTRSTVTIHRHLQSLILFRVIPVTLHGNGRAIQTYAFLDDGSSTTLVESATARKLGLSGDIHPLCLQWTSDIERMEGDSQLVKMEISSLGSLKRHVLKKVHTVKNLNLPVQSLDYSVLRKQFPHLRGLPVHSYESASPTILIGLDNSFLKATLRLREGSKGDPMAAKTRLGWTIYGTLNAEAKTAVHHQFHICAHSSDEDLHNLVKEFFKVEAVGSGKSSVVESDDDQRARKILENTTVRTASGKFQVGLLWKYDCIEFPNSKPMAERRLRCLERRLASKPELYDKVRHQMQQYQAKGYAHKADPEELSNFDPRRTWYLPLNVVMNPRKPNKVRLVWDAAAKVQGQSLNSALLAGPDLLAPLPSFLCPFRQFEVAISADILEMFHQLFIRPEDKSAQLFLWRDDPSNPYEIFVMDVAIFGASCSPSAAQFVKNLNAQEFSDQYPLAAKVIVEHHYVDDFVYSTNTVNEAVELAQQVKEVHSRAGFTIRNWLSNSPEVISRFGVPGMELSKCFEVAKTATQERVLGLVWKPDPDVFVFQGLFREEIRSLLDDTVIPTKRQTLRVVMSIFDPLGLLAVVVVHGKILLQNIWRCKTDWDHSIPDELLDAWRRWTKLLKQLEQVQIPRCYFPGYSDRSYHSLELHIFVDASEEAYAALAYFRIVDSSGVRCSLVSAKTKVAPLKPLSIPRLELQAAVLGAKLSKSVEDNHTLSIVRRVLWTDSSTVLSWLRSDQRKYRQYVAFRVTEILELTQVDEWRWVPSRWNVADEATKWGKGPNISSSSRWFQAPAFLYQEPDTWPQQGPCVVEITEELRTIHLHCHLIRQQLIDFERYSKWERLVRAIAYVYRFIDNCRRKIENYSTELSGWLNQNELQKAEWTIFKLIQHEAYGDEIVTFNRNQHLPVDQRLKLEKTSKIVKLTTVLDDQGVLRMDSRITNAQQFSTDFKFPIILPKGHYGTQLLVDWYHRQSKHINTETAVNEMRQKFYVSEMRSAFRKAKKVCQWCRIYKATPVVPRMAPLPPARTVTHIRPFSYVGVDYFGPVLIRQGRSEVKRWVALFTCLTIRAVHLEVVASMSTESCKMAFRRFIARRGAPAAIYSDRGTNFVGASRELEQELQKIDQGLAATFTNAETQWYFNPPSAPHMGGSWERMVRSVKCALASLSTIRKPNEETFNTLLIEAESMVNSRPLTYMPIESEGHEALTPNCFLMLSTSGVNQPPKMLVDERVILNSNWNLYQQLLDQFWCRWVREYLPTITKRSKWFTDCKPIESGDLVVVVEDRLRNGWIRGRVLRVFPGRDGRVRSAEVKTATGVLQRPVAKLAVLEIGGIAREHSKQYGSGNVTIDNRSASNGSEIVNPSTFETPSK